MSEPSGPDPYAPPGRGAGAGPGRVVPAGSAVPVPPGPPAYSAFAPAAPAYPAAPPGGALPGTQANSLAVWSLALALLGWFCFGLLTSIPAIVVGARAKRAAAEGRANNQGMATAGVVLGWIGTIWNGLVLLAFVVFVAVVGWDGTAEFLENIRGIGNG